MSARLVRRVHDSDLDPALKHTAVTLASLAKADGTRVCPSVARLASWLSRTPRQTQRMLARLRALGVLVPRTTTTGGAGRIVEYVFHADALPARPSLTQERAR
jgi:hypothetical protein